MRRLMMVVMCLLLLAGAAVAEESDSGVYAFSGAWPEMWVEAVQSTPYSKAVPMQAYASMRFGRWDYGQAIARDGDGYVLFCFVNGMEGWEVSASRKALRQDEAPQLWVQAVEEGWSAETIASYGACYEFEIVYDDARYGWFCGTNDWMLTRMVLPVANVVVNRDALYWGEEVVYNTQSYSLADIDLAALPTSLAEAKALADAAGLTDMAQALLTWEDGVYAPGIVMYAAPSRGAKVLARYYAGVAGEVTDMGSGFVKLRIGDEEGWFLREHVLLGGERAAQYPWNGQSGAVYAVGNQRYQTLWATPAEKTAIASLESNFRVNVLAVLSGGKWLQVVLPDGLMGYMHADTVCLTDNLRTAWIENDLPTNRLHLRSKPSTKGESYAKYYSGVPVTLLFCEETVKGWHRVAVEGRAGWMKGDFLNFSSDAESYIDYLPPIATVQGTDAKGLNLRFRPDYDAEILARYPNGTRVEVMGVVGTWAHVRLRDGNTGYMLLKHLGGEPESAVKNTFRLTTAANMTAGETVHALEAGETIRLYGSRPRVEWRYVDDGMQLTEPAQIWAGSGERWGYVDTEKIDFGW